MILPLMQAAEDAAGGEIAIPPNGGLRSNLTYRRSMPRL